MKKRLQNAFLLLIVMVLFVTSIPNTGIAYLQAAEKVRKQIYKKDGCTVLFQENSRWDNGFEGQFIVENNSGKPVENWRLSFIMEQELSSVWDGEIESHKGNQYVLKYPSWNPIIPDGGKAVIGFNAKMSGSVKVPGNVDLLYGSGKTGEENYKISYEVTSDWKDAYNAEISITNLTDQPMEGWSLSFDYDQQIRQIWNAKKVSESGSRYEVKHDGWNSVIRPNETVKFGFEAKRISEEKEPKDYTLLSNQAESSKPEIDIPKEDQTLVENTGETVKSVDKLLPELRSEDPAEIAAKIKEIKGVKDVSQNGYYLTITFDTGIKGELMISTEDSPQTQLRGAETEQVSVYGKRLGEGDRFYYPNEKIISAMENTAQYDTDQNCASSGNKSLLIWSPFHSEWEGNDEVGIAKTIVDNIGSEVKLDIISDKAATAESLKKMSNYGVVILSTHGHGGEWILTSDVVPKVIAPADAKMLLDGQKRIVTRYDAKKNTSVSHFAVTDKWIQQQIKKELPGTVVINNSCESSKTDKLWDALKKKGAATYFGYSGNVRNEFAVLNVSTFLVQYVVEGLSAFQAYGFMDDYYYETSGSHFIAKGQGNIRLDFDAERKTVSPVSFPEAERYLSQKMNLSGRSAQALSAVKSMNLPSDVQQALTALVTSSLTPWPIDEVICAAVFAYVCIRSWDVVKPYWAQIKQMVGDATAGLWDSVETEMARARRSKENAKTKTEVYDIAWEVQPKREEPVPVTCKISYKHGVRSFKKSFIYSANVDSFQKPGKPKPKVKLEMALWYATEKNGRYAVIKKTNIPLVDYRKNYELVVPAKTGHYKLYCYVRPASIGEQVITLSPNERYWCINRTGHIWMWNYTDKDSPAPYEKKRVTEPRATYPHADGDKRMSTLIADYKKDYFNIFGVILNWPEKTYDVHHVQPLFCGGKNYFENLIHLPKKHHGHISDWFRGYF